MILRSCLAALLVLGPAQWAAAQELGQAAGWSGRYFGVTAGALRSEGEAVRGDSTGALIAFDISNGLFPERQKDNEIAALGGLGIGYNFEGKNFVAGLEFDFMFSGLEVTERFSRIDPNPDPAFNGVITETGYRTEIDKLAMLRLRAGIARGPSLFYGTGGLAAGDVTNRFSLDLPNLPAIPGGYGNRWAEDGIRFGYVIGAGLEHRVSERTSIKAELLHFDLEDVTVHAEDPPVFADNSIDYRFKNDGQILRLGLNVWF